MRLFIVIGSLLFLISLYVILDPGIMDEFSPPMHPDTIPTRKRALEDAQYIAAWTKEAFLKNNIEVRDSAELSDKFLRPNRLSPRRFDPWGVPFNIVIDKDNNTITVRSCGADKTAGGVNENKDIAVVFAMDIHKYYPGTSNK